MVFTTRRGGVSKAPFDSLNLKRGLGDSDSSVAANRRAVSHASGVPDTWIEADQVHGSRVLVHTKGHAISGPGDALVTRTSRIPLAIFTADCAPVALIGEMGVGVAHVGWRGLTAGVIEHVIDELAERRLEAWIGPTIGPCHYEVGTDVPEAFARSYPSAPDFIQHREGADFFDLPSAVEWALTSREVTVRTDMAHCTFCDDRFFSFRRDGLTGRQGVLVWKAR